MKRTNKNLKQTYFILERYSGRIDWSIGFASKEYTTVKEALEDIKTFVNEDPTYAEDFEFKLAAANEQLITVRNTITAEVVVQKE